MQNIHFETGKQRFTINGDESKYIEFNPNDDGILTRLRNIQNEIEKRQNELSKIERVDREKTTSMLSDLDKFIRNKIDYLFDSDVSNIVFGNTSCLSTLNGVPLYERFIDAVLPILEKNIKTEMKKSNTRIEKYAGKYVK